MKIRFPDIPEVIIKIEPNLLVSELKYLLSSSFDLSDFELWIPLSNEPLKEDLTMKDYALYPRGLVVVKIVHHPYGFH